MNGRRWSLRRGKYSCAKQIALTRLTAAPPPVGRTCHRYQKKVSPLNLDAVLNRPTVLASTAAFRRQAARWILVWFGSAPGPDRGDVARARAGLREGFLRA